MNHKQQHRAAVRAWAALGDRLSADRPDLDDGAFGVLWEHLLEDVREQAVEPREAVVYVAGWLDGWRHASEVAIDQIIADGDGGEMSIPRALFLLGFRPGEDADA